LVSELDNFEKLFLVNRFFIAGGNIENTKKCSIYFEKKSNNLIFELSLYSL